MRFLNCRIDLSKWNFRPRVETEFWVEKVLEELKIKNSLKIENWKLKINVLDIFSGSGCIGIAVLKACPELCRRVDFADISKNAIEQIRINLKLNKIPPKRYKIYQSDLFKKIGDRRYHYIFANPPYVATERINEVQSSVLKYEPHQALFSGKKGMDAIKKFLGEAKHHLKPGGIIFLEFSPEQKNAIMKLLGQEGYKNYSFFKDQFKKYRWLKIIK